MSDVAKLEKRAIELDEARKIRVIRAQEIDVEKYLKANDVTHQVHEASAYLEEMKVDLASPVKEVTHVMPWSKSHESFRFRAGEVTIYAGSNGGGKSLITGQIALGLIKQSQKLCIASFEMKPKRTLFRMLRQFTGKNIEAPMFQGKVQMLTKEIDRFKTFADKRLFIYDQQGTTSSDQVIAMARYCAVELNIKHVFIDSLMKCVAGEDDYNAQKHFVDELTAVARDHQIHIHLIHHIRKLQNEETQPNKNDIKGSGAIADQVDNVLLMWRNKKKEHDLNAGKTNKIAEPDAMLMCEKQRNGESEEWFNLWYHRDSQQFIESQEGVPMAFDDAGDF
jgi:twinkle protein